MLLSKFGRRKDVIKLRTLFKQKQPLSRCFSAVEQTKDPDFNSMDDSEVHCLMLHPVSWPHHGPVIELYLAEEAVGLVKSLDWQLAKGPMWDQTQSDGEESENEDAEASKRIAMRDAIEYENMEPATFNKSENVQLFKKERIQNGDYVYGPSVQGVFYETGVLLDIDEDEAMKDQEEWTNANLRESVARSSVIRCRKISPTTFFTKVYLNTSLTAVQIKKLEKRWNDILMEREDRLRQYYLKSAQKENFLSPSESDTTSAGSEIEAFGQQSSRKIRVIDRFGMIMQIFAARATSSMAQLQIELAWMRYAKTLLTRGNTPSFGVMKGMFGGNLMRQETVELETKSAKGQGTRGQVGGAGETQLQMEQYNLKLREAKLLQALEQLRSRQAHGRAKRESTHKTQPLIALIGYTNAGKSAVMNLCTNADVESKDLLFQTLNTTNRGYRMPNGQHAVMLDTIGFITDLPHGLVDSFKATLDEIHFADVIVHIRDISHPQSQHQKDTVLKVLHEIGVSDLRLKENYVEVWNKIDLVDDRDKLEEDYLQAISQNNDEFPVVMMSCETGENKTEFLNTISDIASQIMGKKLYDLEYPCEEHHKRLSWLYKHASITQEEDFEYQGDSISIKVLLDEVTYQQYLKVFEPQEFQKSKLRGRELINENWDEDENITQIKAKRGMPPPGWQNR